MLFFFFFFFNDTATTEIYTLSLHDALPIFKAASDAKPYPTGEGDHQGTPSGGGADRKSTRLNSSHSQISYAVFCLKKKTSSVRTAAVFAQRSLIFTDQWITTSSIVITHTMH